MKKLSAVVLAAALTASTAVAGGLSPTIDVVPVVKKEPASSVSPLLIIGLLVLVGVLVSRNNDNEDNG
jgi:hypothetical protein